MIKSRKSSRGKPAYRLARLNQFETLEGRRMLAADLLGVETIAVPRIDDPGFYSEVSQANSATPLSEVSVPSLPANDAFHYLASGERIELTPVEGSYIIGVDAGTEARMQPLVNNARNQLFGDANTEIIGTRMMLVERASQAAVEDQLEHLAADNQVDRDRFWIAPTFTNGQSGLTQRLTDEVIVSLKADADPEAFFADAEYASYRPLRGTTDQFVATLSTGGGMRAMELANQELPAHEAVEWASVNFFSEIEYNFVPNDPSFPTQWHLNNTGQSGGSIDADADLVQAWDASSGDGVVIAIYDDGVDTSHPDLSIWANPNEIPGNGMDDDGNGWVDDVNGINLADGAGGIDDTNMNDPNPSAATENHGTPVAGVASSRTDNGLGGAGAGRNAQIMAVKSCGTFCLTSALAEGIYYSAGRTADGTGTWRGADVSNHSYGISPFTEFTTAVDWATSNGRNGLGTPAVAATGNSASGYGAPFSTTISIPASVINAGAQVELRYSKNGSVDAGEDGLWIANIKQPGGITNRFDNFGDFEGWTGGGDVLGAMTSDPAYQYGTGRHSLQAGAGNLTHNQSTSWFSPEIETDGQFSFHYWVSSEPNADGLEVFVRYRNFFGLWDPWNPVSNLISGEPAVTAPLAYPANMGSVIAVGASTDFDYRSAYSQYGSGLDIVAPSNGGNGSIFTTDRTGAAGGTPDNFFPTFGGTSSASPLAAGVAALLIADNPEITAGEVRTALRNSAEEIGGVEYTSGTNWFYGHGRLDADGALHISGEDSNDQISEASTAALDTTIEGRIGSAIDVDLYAITVGAGTRVGFDTDNTAGDTALDTYLRVFDASGNELTYSDDRMGPAPEVHHAESYLEFNFTTAGTYYVGVSAFDNSAYDAITGSSDEVALTTGNYELHVTDLTDESLFVTNIFDFDNGTTFDGVSLREAIGAANSLGGGTITFDTDGVFATPQTVSLTFSSELAITSSVSIEGPTTAELSIDANGQSRVFNIFDGDESSLQTVSLSDLTIKGGLANNGAGILSRENVTLDRLTVSGNTSTSGTAGPDSGGGGIHARNGNLVIKNSTVSANMANAGGGLRVLGADSVSIENSTFSGNADAAISVYNGIVDITQTTITANDQGVVTNNNAGAATVTFGSSIVAGNTSNDVTGPNNVDSTGYNLVGDGNAAAGAFNRFTEPGDMAGVTDPMLGSLSDNGGPTQTHAPLVASPAVNGGDPAVANGIDQTGEPRVIGGVTDIGAVEVNPPVVRLLGSIPEGMSTQPAYDLRETEVAFYRFVVDADVAAADMRRLSIDTFGTTLDSGNDTELGLYDSNGDLVAENDDDDGNGFLSKLSFGAGGDHGDLAAGTYYLSISGWNTSFGTANFDVTSTSDDNGDLIINFNLGTVGPIGPDFNEDGNIDGADVDLLQANLVNGPLDPGTFDLNGDGQVTIADRDEWLAQAGAANLPSGNPYLLGDANLDGTVDGVDFVAWNNNKFTSNSDWTAGDFNADGTVNGVDFVDWNNNKFMSADASAVVSDRNDVSGLFDMTDEDEDSRRYERQVDDLFAAFV